MTRLIDTHVVKQLRPCHSLVDGGFGAERYVVTPVHINVLETASDVRGMANDPSLALLVPFTAVASRTLNSYDLAKSTTSAEQRASILGGDSLSPALRSVVQCIDSFPADIKEAFTREALDCYAYLDRAKIFKLITELFASWSSDPEDQYALEVSH